MVAPARSSLLVILSRWCPWRGSNTRPLPYQGSALPLSYMGARCNPHRTGPPGPWRALYGAGEGNRTLVVSLEGFCSTIELHPRFGVDVKFCYLRCLGSVALLRVIPSGLSYVSQSGGGGRIRTFEGRAGRFTVCSRWPLGYPSDETAYSSNFRSQVSNSALFLNS